jgi:hypothetical protein
MIGAGRASYEFSGTFLAVVAALAVTGLVVGAVLIYQDVERHDGDGIQAALAWVLFWPLG